MPELVNLISRLSDTESLLSAQFGAQGINLAQTGPSRDEVKNVNFTFELPATPSLRELGAAISQVDRVIRVASGLAAYSHTELGIIPPGSVFGDLESLETWLQSDSEAWDLEIEWLELGSVRLNVKPKGKFIKKVATGGLATLSLAANLVQLTGYTPQDLAHDVAGGAVGHTSLYVNGKSINVPQQREEDIIFRLPPGSTLTETIYIGNDKRIVLEMKPGPEGAKG